MEHLKDVIKTLENCELYKVGLNRFFVVRFLNKNQNILLPEIFFKKTLTALTQTVLCLTSLFNSININLNLNAEYVKPVVKIEQKDFKSKTLKITKKSNEMKTKGKI